MAYRIYLEHGEAYGNLGDEAMLVNAARRLRRTLGEVEFIVPKVPDEPLPDIGSVEVIPSPRPAIDRLMRQLVPSGRVRKWVRRQEYDPLAMVAPSIMRLIGGIGGWRTLVNRLRSCDGVYFVGAANLNDFARYSCVLPKYSLWAQARALNKPVIISSQTVGPLDMAWPQWMVRRMVEQSTFFSVRDGGVSKDKLSSIGVDPESIHFVGDEAFSLSPAPADEARAYLANQGLSPEPPFALFHFRATDYTQSTEKHYDKLAAALDAVETEARICFLPMSYGEHSGRDQECGEAIRQRMQHPDKLVVLKPTRDVRVVRRLFEMAQWAMGLSYHLQVFALAAACPMAILSSGGYYRIKAEGMQQLVGDKIPLLWLDSVSSSSLAETMHRLEGNGAEYAAHLEKARSKVEQNNQAPVSALARVLNVS